MNDLEMAREGFRRHIKGGALDGTIQDAYWKVMEKSDLPRLFPPWQFQFPGYLYPPGRLVELFSVCLDSYFMFGPEAMDHAEAGALADCCAQLAWSKGRIYGVTREIASALWQTAPCPGITIAEIPMPMPTVFLTLPRDTIPWGRKFAHEEEGEWVSYAMITKFNPADEHRARLVREFAKDRRGLDLQVQPKGDAPDDFYRIILVSNAGWMQRLQGDGSHQVIRPMSSENTLSSYPITEDDQHMTGFVWNVISAMNARPDLVVGGQVSEIRKKRGGKRETVPLVRIPLFGAGYRVQSEVKGGHHASPTAHWRRGHFRNQACGKGRRERKMIWLEPCLVAPNG